MIGLLVLVILSVFSFSFLVIFRSPSNKTLEPIGTVPAVCGRALWFGCHGCMAESRPGADGSAKMLALRATRFGLRGRFGFITKDYDALAMLTKPKACACQRGQRIFCFLFSQHSLGESLGR
jgi:hypothetical protein